MTGPSSYTGGENGDLAMDMIAKKNFRYGGRALTPGDPFRASSKDARLLGKIGRARAATGTYSAPAPARETKRPDRTAALDHDHDGKAGGSTAPAKSDELAEVRAEYRRVTGKRFFPLWGVAELRRRMAEHQAKESPATQDQAPADEVQDETQAHDTAQDGDTSPPASEG